MQAEQIEHLFCIGGTDPTVKLNQKHFIIKENIGHGSYGTVYHCLKKGSEEEYAVKMIDISNRESELEKIYQEIEIMKECNHKYIVYLFGSFISERVLWIVMEFSPIGSVSDLMKICKRKLTENQIAAILACAVRGLICLHRNNIIHRDIKAGNILLFKDAAKLADFGASARILDGKKLKTLAGSSYWMAPEMIKVDTGYDFKADIWALGITAIELAQSAPPLHQVHHAEVIFSIPTQPSPVLDEPNLWSDEFNDFISVCLLKNPSERPTAEQLLRHKFIQKGIFRIGDLRTLVQECTPILADYRYEADLDSGNWLRPNSRGLNFDDDLDFVD